MKKQKQGQPSGQQGSDKEQKDAADTSSPAEEGAAPADTTFWNR